MGGWLNPLIVDYIEDYADLLFEQLGDKVLNYRFSAYISKEYKAVSTYFYTGQMVDNDQRAVVDRLELRLLEPSS